MASAHFCPGMENADSFWRSVFSISECIQILLLLSEVYQDQE